MTVRPDPEFYRCRPVWYPGVPLVEDVDHYEPITEDERQAAFRYILASIAAFGIPTAPPGPERLPRPRVWVGGLGKRWPNVLGEWSQNHEMLVHECVADTLRATSLRGYQLAEVEVGSFAAGRKPFPTPTSRYFVLKASGYMNYSLRVYERMDNGRRHEFLFETADFSSHPREKEISAGHGRYPKRRMPLKDTWDGSDFFALGTGQYMPSSFYCTRAFLELVRTQRWSGFAFHPLDALGESWTDYRKRPWPPSQWYPASQPD